MKAREMCHNPEINLPEKTACGATTKEDSDKVYRRGSRSPCLYTPEYTYLTLRDLRSINNGTKL